MKNWKEIAIVVAFILFLIGCWVVAFVRSDSGVSLDEDGASDEVSDCSTSDEDNASPGGNASEGGNASKGGMEEITLLVQWDGAMYEYYMDEDDKLVFLLVNDTREKTTKIRLAEVDKLVCKLPGVSRSLSMIEAYFYNDAAPYPCNILLFVNESGSDDYDYEAYKMELMPSGLYSGEDAFLKSSVPFTMESNTDEALNLLYFSISPRETLDNASVGCMEETGKDLTTKKLEDLGLDLIPTLGRRSDFLTGHSYGLFRGYEGSSPIPDAEAYVFVEADDGENVNVLEFTRSTDENAAVTFVCGLRIGDEESVLVDALGEGYSEKTADDCTFRYYRNDSGSMAFLVEKGRIDNVYLFYRY